jgi:tRNA dimethylallyltransferase
MSASGADYLCLAGPTASGKSAAALAIAAALAPRRAVEIVSVDSALVYRGMDIGTAKPSAAERAAVPHHLIERRPVRARYSAARFVADAAAAVAAILARPRPVAGWRHDAVLQGAFDGLDACRSRPRGASRHRRARGTHGQPGAPCRLAAIDPTTAARLERQPAHPARARVHRVRGRPLWPGAAPDGLTPPLIALEPNHAWLHAHRRTLRGDVDAGFVDEVRRLRARADLHANLPSCAVGYRQAWSALESGERRCLTPRQLAKRQLTWLRSMPWRRVACDASDRSTGRRPRPSPRRGAGLADPVLDRRSRQALRRETVFDRPVDAGGSSLSSASRASASRPPQCAAGLDTIDADRRVAGTDIHALGDRHKRVQAPSLGFVFRRSRVRT